MGKGGSSQKSSTTTVLPPAMTNAMNAQVGASTPILQMLAQQIMQALSTGGAGAQIPMVQSAVEAGQNAVGQTNRQTNENVKRSGIGPFGRQVTEGGAQKGAFDVSQLSPQIIQQLLGMAPDIGMMRGSGVFSNAAGSKTTSSGSSGGGIMDILGPAMSIGAMFMCYTALELYGVSPELAYARWWIGYAWKGRTANIVRAVYGRYSIQLACVVRRSKLLRALAKPLFDVAVRKGKEAW